MPSNTAADNSFNQSFLLSVKLRDGRGHSLKSHARRGTALHELLGILDLLAGNDPQRFVVAGIAALVKLCNKGARKNGVHYTEAWVKEALAELRTRHIISRYFTARDGRKGLIVAPHDSLCYRRVDVCVLHAPKRYECDNETAERLRETGNPPGMFFPVAQPADNLPAAYRQPTGNLLQNLPRNLPRNLPISEKKPTAQPTAQPTDGAPQPADKSAVVERQSEIWQTVGTQIGAPNRVTGRAVEPKEPKEPSNLPTVVEPADSQELSQEKEKCKQTETEKDSFNTTDQNPTEGRQEGSLCSLTLGAAAPKNPAKDKSPTVAHVKINAKFSELLSESSENDCVIETVSTGLIARNDITAVSLSQRFYSWQELAQCCREVIAEHGSEQYLGPKTHGDVMAWAMGLFKEQQNENTPPCWYAVAKKLRQSPPEMVQAEAVATDDNEANDGEPFGAIGVLAKQEGIDMTPFEEEVLDRGKHVTGGWSGVWQFFGNTDIFPQPLPESLARLRDVAFQRDASANKPTTPPWETSAIVQEPKSEKVQVPESTDPTSELLDEFFLSKENLDNMGMPKSEDKKALDALVKQYGKKTVRTVLDEFMQRREGFAYLHFPWGVFFRDAQTYLKRFENQKGDAVKRQEKQARQDAEIDAEIMRLEAEAQRERDECVRKFPKMVDTGSKNPLDYL
jgi:hypothetical protein